MSKNKMNTIYINKGEYLSQILDELPTNSHIHKYLPNIGATERELSCRRHSILLEANVPVILGKQSKQIFGVYEGVYKEDVMDYLYNDVEFKKIMVTPESFNKVKEAIEEVGWDMYNDFFLLFDECERIIQDVSYRKNITLPMHDFFMFKEKAFISATPLQPSDPRFEAQSFNNFYIVPNFDSAINIKLVPTNNILLSLTRYFRIHPADHYCIFLNSTETIAAIIKTLKIKDESHVFCAKESVVNFRANNLPIASSNFDKHKIKKYNFFSSRFNSAVDLKVDFKPNVLIISDLTKALHSMVDPLTQVVQIIGRWRNGFNNVTHITNLKPNLPSKTATEILSYLEGCESAYNTIKSLRQSATTDGARETLEQCLKLVEYANFINERDGAKNYFMVDNEINNHRVNSYYHNNETILNAYNETERFVVDFKPEDYPMDDNANNRLKIGLSRAALYKLVCDNLEKCNHVDNTFNFYGYIVRSQLHKMFPTICKAYHILGYPAMAELDFKPTKIDAALEKIVHEQERNHFGFITVLKKAFIVNKAYSTQSVFKMLAYAIKKYGLKLRPSLKLLKCYYEVKRTTIDKKSDGKEIKGYRIVKARFN